MEFRQITYFEAVCRNRSITKAAKELFVTQQCVSKQISLLEHEMGTPLLQRRANGVIPTEEGQWFFEHASMILQIDQDIQTHFELRRKGAARVLRVGISNGLNLFYDDPFFGHLQELHPDISIQVLNMWNRQIEEMLESGGLDIGISLLPVQNKSLYVKQIFSEPVCCIVNRSNALADREFLRFEDIVHEQVALADENFNTYRAFLERCEKEGVTPNLYKSSDLMSIYFYVLNHNAVGFSLNSYAQRFHVDQIRHIPYTDEGGFWYVCILMRERDRDLYERYVGDFADVKRKRGRTGE